MICDRCSRELLAAELRYPRGQYLYCTECVRAADNTAALDAEYCPKCRCSVRCEQAERDLAAARAEVEAMRPLLTEARTCIDMLNANTQGQDRTDVRDPITYAICLDLIARLDAATRGEKGSSR